MCAWLNIGEKMITEAWLPCQLLVSAYSHPKTGELGAAFLCEKTLREVGLRVLRHEKACERCQGKDEKVQELINNSLRASFAATNAPFTLTELAQMVKERIGKEAVKEGLLRTMRQRSHDQPELLEEAKEIAEEMELE